MSLDLVFDDFERMIDSHRKKELLINEPLTLLKEYVSDAYFIGKRVIREEYIKRFYSLS